jgi:hypothetical protein
MSSLNFKRFSVPRICIDPYYLDCILGFFLAVAPPMSLQEHAGSDKTWVWHATDFSDGELKEELFYIRLGSVDSEHCS